MTIADVLPLFRQLNDLKRLHVADHNGSIAERIFIRSWARLVDKQDLEVVAREETVNAVIATQLAGIDARVLTHGGLKPSAITEIQRSAFEAATQGFPPRFAARLFDSLSEYPEFEWNRDLPEFVERLARQPRAGATRPGHGRIVLEPTENHAEHCAIVAVQGVLATSVTGGDVGSIFLTSLSHHLHNAYLPDAGDAGDALLGRHLEPMITKFRELTLSQISSQNFNYELRDEALTSLGAVFRADTPESRAFQIADSLDRVLEMEWHARSASFTLDVALGEMDIIHPGPVQAYQLEVMRQAGFIAP